MSVLFSIIGLVVGGIATVWGYRRRAYHQVISGTPTSRVLDVDEPGLVELKGEVAATGDDAGTMQAPLSGDTCVVAGWEVDEWNEGGKNSSWHEIAEGYDSVPFLVDDGSAEILVRPGSDADASNWTSNISLDGLDDSVAVDGVTVDFQHLRVEHQLDPDDPTPARVEEFERRAPGIDAQTGSVFNAIDFGNAHGERKYKEGIVQPGDSVYLLGAVEPADGDARPDRRLRPEDAVVTPAGDDEFILSTRSEEQLLSKSRYGLPAMVVGAVVMAASVLYTIGL
ncbi:hypothetical protein [Halorubellus sp. PRR65]|uniref:hypothetical protein n=1 Tax=Halorubellus sp. PRR65 TaxID=3098148 RepID=UPI002B2578EE|nr:hypothetical protein [Halorubellus sp. PRR65]